MRLPCCHFVFCGHFPPEVTTDMWFMMAAGLCVDRNKELGHELQAAELNAYLVAKDSFLVAKAFQKLKMCRGLYTWCMVGVAKKIAQLRNFDRLYLGHIFLSEIHKWPLIFFLKSSIFSTHFLWANSKKNFGLKSLFLHSLQEFYCLLLLQQQARSWHADDVIQTPHVASRPFFFFLACPSYLFGKGRIERNEITWVDTNCVLDHATLVDGVIDRGVLALCRTCTRTIEPIRVREW